MSSDLNLVIMVNQADANSGEYPVQLWHEGKPLADAKTRIDRQALLTHEHAYNAHDYGMELYDALFTGAVGRAYQRLIGKAGAEATVRVQLVIHPAAHELHALPWERLFHVFGDTDTPLTTSAQTPFSRFLTTGAGDQSPVSDRPLHLLLAIANPENLPAELSTLDVAGEAKALADLLAGLPRKVVGTVLPGRTGLPDELQNRLTKAGWTVANGVTSWQNIQRHLQDGQHILHILAHGQLNRDGKAYLLLEHEGAEKVARGSLERVLDQEIVTSLAGVRPLPQLIFLAACESAKRPANQANPFVGLAPKLVESGVPAVVAMQDLVPIPLAHLLTLDFYRRLFEHGQVDRALNEARTLLYKQNAFEWAIPVLFLRLKHGQLFASQDLVPTERVRFDGLIEEYTQLFAGRDAAIAELETFMQNPAGGYLLVTAGAGLGKTALMANLVARHRDTLAYHFFSPRISESLQEEIFLRNLLEQMGAWYDTTVPLAGQSNELRKYYDKFLGQSPQGIQTIVLDGLDEVTGWDLARYLTRRLPAGLHFILTVRDVGQNPVEVYALPVDQVQSMPIVGLTRAGVQAVFRLAGGGAVQFAENDTLLEEVLRVTLYDQNKPALGADTFFVRFLAEDAATGQMQPEEITHLPAQMAVYLDRWWNSIKTQFGEEGNRKKREQAMVDLAGTLAAALGPISQADLEVINPSLVSEIEQDFVATVAQAAQRVVVRDQRGDYTLLHPRLRDYLRQKLKTGPYIQRLLDYGAQWRQSKSHYTFTYYARHLAHAAQAAAQPERHKWTERLVRLVVDAKFQDEYLARVKNLGGLQADLAHALQSTIIDESPQGLPLLVESALAHVRLRRERLRPEPLFDLARQGDVAGARRMLDLFDVDRKWRQATLLTIGWLAADAKTLTAKAEAEAIHQEVEAEITDLPQGDQRRLLLRRIKGEPPDQSLPPATSESELRAAIDNAAGVATEPDVSPKMLYRGLPTNANLLARGLELAIDTEDFSDEIFMSYYIGPQLVAYIKEQPVNGARYWKEYLGVHSSYNYPNYRFGSLWALLQAVLLHPDPAWVQEKTYELAVVALGGAGVEFEEGLPLTLLALQAIAEHQEANTTIKAYTGHIEEEVNQLGITLGTSDPGIEQGDRWGRYKRLLGVLAQINAHLAVDIGHQPTDLLDRALKLHYGLAGYQAPACLALAEAIRVCRPHEETAWIERALEAAQQAAHHINEGTFCARTTARVNAMRAAWWPSIELNVGQKCAALQAEPRAPEFASFHYVGEQYQDRGPASQTFPLPQRVLGANTLAKLADAYQRGLPEFLRLNRGWEPDQVIPVGERIYVPDPGLAPWLAARLAAEALVATGLTKPQRAAMIRKLVPVATPNATALDIVLMRLLLAETPSDPPILEQLASLVPLPQAV